MVSPTGLDIQTRDLDVLKLLADFRGVTLPHLRDLYFSGRESACRTRIARLQQADLLAPHPVKLPTSPPMLRLTKRGYDVLVSAGKLVPEWNHITSRENRGTQALVHDQGILKCYVTLTQYLAEQPDLSLAAFRPYPKCLGRLAWSRDRGATQLHPDAYFQIMTPAGANHFLLEVDRGTEPLRVIREKAAAYRQRLRTGPFLPELRDDNEPDRCRPFRVLFTVPSEARQQNMCHAMLELHPPVLSLCWAACYQDFHRAPLGPIWLSPQDLRTARRTGALPERKILSFSLHPDGKKGSRDAAA